MNAEEKPAVPKAVIKEIPYISIIILALFLIALFPIGNVLAATTRDEWFRNRRVALYSPFILAAVIIFMKNIIYSRITVTGDEIIRYKMKGVILRNTKISDVCAIIWDETDIIERCIIVMNNGWEIRLNSLKYPRLSKLHKIQRELGINETRLASYPATNN